MYQARERLLREEEAARGAARELGEGEEVKARPWYYWLERPMVVALSFTMPRVRCGSMGLREGGGEEGGGGGGRGGNGLMGWWRVG